ncbi:hypothetical protein [Microbacterium sp. RURRCA19A]|uniref:hypothetical protein n=1 Tax=Microbacterium sp. RURRCA19A TaxID=1907391 RepID=UPI0011155968|nr:hypothetical protein [Microbacterium sp. RURRCA19A]
MSERVREDRAVSVGEAGHPAVSISPGKQHTPADIVVVGEVNAVRAQHVRRDAVRFTAVDTPLIVDPQELDPVSRTVLVC